MTILKSRLTQLSFTTGVSPSETVFRFYRENRPIKEKTLKMLRKSLPIYGQIEPIILSSDGYIVNGQHRYMVLKELGMPIWHTTNNNATKEHIEESNNCQNHWNTSDRVHNQAENNFKDMIALQTKYSAWPEFSHAKINDAYLAQGETGSSTKYIKEKKYIFDRKLGDKTLEICKVLDDKKLVQGGKAKDGRYVRAVRAVVKQNPHIDLEVLLKKATMNPLRAFKDFTDICENIIGVYNYKTRKGHITWTKKK